MKKIFGALMIAVCIGMAMPAQAQLHFGVKGGLNLSKASFSDVKTNFKKDNFTGFFIGPMAEFNIPVVGLGVDASLLFVRFRDIVVHPILPLYLYIYQSRITSYPGQPVRFPLLPSSLKQYHYCK